jgi:hypothetical protein
MTEKHIALIYPGLSDHVKFVSFFTKPWRNYDLDVRVHAVPWLDTEESFEAKMERGLALIDEYAKEAEFLSLIGISGGGSFAYNLFCERVNTIHRMVNICGRLREGEDVFPTLEIAAEGKTAFAQSVKHAEQNALQKTQNFHRNILTIRPKFGDETVPVSTMTLEGAENQQIPTNGHIFSIGYALLFPQMIVHFLQQKRF